MSLHKSALGSVTTEPIIRHIAADFAGYTPTPTEGALPVKEFSANGPNSASRRAEAQTGTPDMSGRHVLFILVRNSDGQHPVVRTLNPDGKRYHEALMIFTRRESAAFYLQSAQSDDYNIVSLAPNEAVNLLRSAASEGIDRLVVNAKRFHQVIGDPDDVVPVTVLDHDPTGENLYQLLFDIPAAQQPT